MADTAYQKRRTVLKSAGIVGTTTLSGLAGCLGDDEGDPADYPSETIDLIIPYGPGGSSDGYSRAFASAIEEILDVDISPRNEEGAQQMNAGEIVMNADPDGHTFGHFFAPVHPITAANIADFSLTDAEVICGVGPSTVGIFADTDFGLEGDPEGMADLLDDGEISRFGGTQPATEIIYHYYRQERGWNWETFVPYDSAGEIVQAVASGEMPLGSASYAATADAIAEGNIDLVAWPRQVGVPTGDASPLSGDQLTFLEPEEDLMGGQTHFYYFPPDTPDEIVATMEDAFSEAFESEEIAEWVDDTGNPIDFTPRNEMAELVEESIDAAEEMPTEEIF